MKKGGQESSWLPCFIFPLTAVFLGFTTSRQTEGGQERSWLPCISFAPFCNLPSAHCILPTFYSTTSPVSLLTSHLPRSLSVLTSHPLRSNHAPNSSLFTSYFLHYYPFTSPFSTLPTPGSLLSTRVLLPCCQADPNRWHDTERRRLLSTLSFLAEDRGLIRPPVVEVLNIQEAVQRPSA